MTIRKILFQAVVGLLLFVSCAPNGANRESVRPNVLFIIIDDLNDYEGIYGGHPQARTPNIDRLANEGAWFANAHTNIGLCNPSRNSLLKAFRGYINRTTIASGSHKADGTTSQLFK